MTNCEVLGDGTALACVASVLVTLPCKVLWDALTKEDTTNYSDSSLF